jgi:hypothetical protein
MTPPDDHRLTWSVVQRGFELRILFGDGDARPQYAVLHTDSSYLRLCPSLDSVWGTSAVLLPAFWWHGALLQGAAVAVHWGVEESSLLLRARGRVALLDVDLEMRLSPPGDGHLRVEVSARAAGDVHPDNRPGEAFRPVTLSSMRIGSRKWDAQRAFADYREYALDQPGWIVDARSGVLASKFGLVGGTSDWKRNAPTVEVELDRRRAVGGWLTRSDDPNDDNLSLWCAADTVPREWSYTLHAWRAR